MHACHKHYWSSALVSPAAIYLLPSILTNVFQQHRIVLSFFLYYKTKEITSCLSHKLSKVYDSLVDLLLLPNIILYILVRTRKIVSDLTPKIPFIDT